MHIRKTAGTTLNQAFLGLGSDDADALYLTLARSDPHDLVARGYRFAAWDQNRINAGEYFYAFSHLPFWNLRLPPRTYLFTCLRDPVKRVLSHYQMLMDYRRTDFQHYCREVEDPWLGDSLRDFIERIPPSHLLNQLWMFSEKMDVTEAVRGLRTMSRVLFTEELAEGLANVENDLGVRLSTGHAKKSSALAYDSEDIRLLREKLQPEYEMIAAFRRDGP